MVGRTKGGEGVKEPKPKKCKSKGCGVLFTPTRPMQTVCSVMCAVLDARIKREQAETKKRQEQRRKDREARDKLKTRSDWIKEAQREFNKYIRLRDAGLGCISCDAQLVHEAAAGGGYDCGHFRSVGSAPHLRFDPRNAAGQCKRCNRYGSGRVVEYRKGLVLRHGLAFVEGIEADQTPRHYTVDDLKAIRDKYRALAKQLEKEAA